MKATQFRNMKPAEINTRISELKAELFNLRFQHATNQLENPVRIVEVRKDIARAKTVLREIEISQSASKSGR